MLTCGQAEHLLSQQLDRELAAERRGELEAHLQRCAACRRTLDAWSRIGVASIDVLRRSIPLAPMKPLTAAPIACAQAEQLLSRQLDRELAAERRGELEAHLQGCAACRQTLDAWSRIGAASIDVLRRSIPVAPMKPLTVVRSDAKAAAGQRTTLRLAHRRAPQASREGPLRQLVLIAAVLLVSVVALLVLTPGPGPAGRRPGPDVAKGIDSTPITKQTPPAPVIVQAPRPDGAQSSPDGFTRKQPEAPVVARVAPAAEEPAPPAPVVAPPQPVTREPERFTGLPPAPSPAQDQPKAGTIPSAVAPPAPAAFARVERVQGTVVIVADGGPRAAQEKDELFTDQGVQTVGAESAAVLRFDDKTQLDMKGNTTIARLFERGTAKGVAAGRRIDITQGVVTAEVTRQPSGRLMVFTTPHGTATVLGTRFTLTVTADATRLDVALGRVRFTKKDDGTVDVLAGNFAVSAPGTSLATRPITAAKPALLQEDFSNPALVQQRWLMPPGDFTLTLSGGRDSSADIVMASRAAAAGDGWHRGTGVQSRMDFRVPFKVSADVEISRQHENFVTDIRFFPPPGKGNEQENFFVELRGTAYALNVDGKHVREEAASGNWPRRERWTVEMLGEEVRMLVDDREVLRGRHGKRVQESYRFALEANGRNDVPADARVRFDNVRVEAMER